MSIKVFRISKAVRTFVQEVYPKAKELKNLTDNPKYRFQLWMNTLSNAESMMNGDFDMPILFSENRPMPQSDMRYPSLPIEALLKIKIKLDESNKKDLLKFHRKMNPLRMELNEIISPLWNILELVENYITTNPEILSYPFITKEEAQKMAEICQLISDEYADDVSMAFIMVNNQPAIFIDESKAKRYEELSKAFKLLANICTPEKSSSKAG